jgi:hypothetical protein
MTLGRADDKDAATQDVDSGDRVGTRSVSLGHRPYLDPQIVSRRQALSASSRAAGTDWREE